MDRVKKKGDDGSFNFTRIFFCGQTTGQGCSALHQVPTEIVETMSTRLELQRVPGIIAEVEDTSLSDPDTCLHCLKDILEKLSSLEQNVELENESPNDPAGEFGKLFREYGGIRVLKRVIMFESLLPTRHIFKREKHKQLKIKSLCMEIMCRLISNDEEGENITKELAEDSEFLSYLFILLAFDKTFLTSCQLIEDILQEQRVLDLNKISVIRQVIASLDDVKLSNFCRVLAITISDLDVYENKSSLFAQNKQKRTHGFVNTRDVNQELLLGIPDLLPRLVRIISSREYTPRYCGAPSELDCWMEWIDNSLADSLHDIPICDDDEEFIGGISTSVEGGAIVQQPSLRMNVELVNKVEVVYTLGLFLVGKHRKKVQRRLAELKLVPALSDMFDQFIWKCQGHRSNHRGRLRGHNASCECSPEVALKIQFLRLVHSFCDHSEYKHLLISKSELSELKKIDAKAGPLAYVGNLDAVNKSLMCKGSKGLLSKIVEVLKKEPTASTFRFWLARAVESYLRGSTSFCDQIFLLRRGLLQHVGSNIVDNDIRPKEILQSSFDLLGELVKFNVDGFRVFDKILSTQQKMDKFRTVLNRNLVDSNMFIRSLILSLEHFTREQPENKEYAMSGSRLLKFVNSFDQQMSLVHRLISIINVRNLTQENVSCLNTALVFLMSARQKSELPRYLCALRDEKGVPVQDRGRGCTMKNFRDLLIFWQDHYLHKDKDCSALEKSSKISFEFWKETVTTLVAENRNSECAVIHYMRPCNEYRDS